MKKSILWTAAGVVSATALCAALSLPQTQSAGRLIRRSLPVYTMIPHSGIRVLQTRVVRDSDGGQFFVCGPAEPFTLTWDGNAMSRRSPHAITLTITRRVQESGPGFVRNHSSSTIRTLQPGETLGL